MIETMLTQLEKFASMYNGLLLTGVVTFLLLIFILLLQRQRIKQWLDEFSLTRALRATGMESLHEVSIPDGIEGSAWIEHAALTPQGIMVMVIKRYRGVIFAGDKIEQWTQVMDNRSYKFPNPIHQLEESILAIRAHINKDVPLIGRVLFIKGSQFPRGKPEQVLVYEDIISMKHEKVAESIPPEIRTAWQRLTEVASKDDSFQQQGMMISQTGRDEQGRNGISVILLLLLGLWLAWRLVLN